MSGYAKKECDNCKRKVRILWKTKNKFLCHICYLKEKKIEWKKKLKK